MSRLPRYEVYRAADGWRWRLVGGNGRIVATGEAHPRKANALRAVRRLPDIACMAQLAPTRVLPEPLV